MKHEILILTVFLVVVLVVAALITKLIVESNMPMWLKITLLRN